MVKNELFFSNMSILLCDPLATPRRVLACTACQLHPTKNKPSKHVDPWGPLGDSLSIPLRSAHVVPCLAFVVFQRMISGSGCSFALGWKNAVILVAMICF